MVVSTKIGQIGRGFRRDSQPQQALRSYVYS
jgi:hypothetical protein